MSSQEIRTHISSIINCYICNIGRASNMFWLTFSTSSQEIDANKHEIAIHVQSTWRIVRERKIIIASSDFYSPCTSLKNQNNFKWDVQGNNLFDEKSKLWLNDNSPIFVKEYTLNKFGDLKIIFSNQDSLEVFIDSSDNTECWRLIGPFLGEKHLVLTGLGFALE